MSEIKFISENKINLGTNSKILLRKFTIDMCNLANA